MKYGLLSLGIFTTLQTITFIYYLCQKKPPKTQPLQETFPEIFLESLTEPLQETFPETLPEPLQETLPEPSPEHKTEIIMLLQKHKESLIKYNDEIIKIQNEILILRDKLCD